MKNFKSKVATFSLAASLFLFGCAKENNKFDKILTDGTWKVDSWSQTYESITNRDYVTSTLVDVTNTYRETTEKTSSTEVYTEYNETLLVPGAKTFDRTINNSNSTMNMTFNEDGTYTYEIKSTLKSTSYEDETTPVSTTNVSATENVSTGSGYWSWANTTDTKTQINLSNFGMFDVTLEKGKATFENKSNSVNKSLRNDGNDYNYTSTSNQNIKFTATK